MPRLRQQHDVEGVVATDVHDLVDLVVGWLDVERAQHDRYCVTEHADGRHRALANIIGLDPGSGSSRLVATDKHGNMSSDSRMCSGIWEFPGSRSFGWETTISATNHIGHTQCRYRPQCKKKLIKRNENEMPATASPLFFMFPLTRTSRHLKLLLKYIRIIENACVGVAKFGTITRTWSEFTNFNFCRQ